MKKKSLSGLDILYLLSLTDDKYLAECENYTKEKVPFYRRREFITAFSAAACFALIITAAYYTRTGMKNSCNECYVEPSRAETMADTGNDISEAVPETGSADDYEDIEIKESAAEEAVPEAPAAETEAMAEEAAPVEEAAPSVPAETVPSDNTVPEFLSEPEVAEVTEAEPELPALTMNTELDYGGGFEGTMYLSDEEFLDCNPGYLPEIDGGTLPVYKNPHPNKAGVPGGLTFDEMTAKFTGLCGYFNVDDSKPTLIYDENNTLSLGEDYVTYIQSEGYFTHSQSGETVVSLSATGSWSVFFGEAVTPAQDCTTPEEAALYFADMYGDVLSLGDEIKVEVRSDRNIHGEINSSYYIYRKSAVPDKDELLSRELDFAELYLDENLSLTGIRRTVMPEKAEKVGDYPIISADEALDMLKSGAFLTTVPDTLGESMMYDRDNITSPMSVELCYRSEAPQEYFMPYYRFKIKLNRSITTDDGESLTSYGAFYVPAVRQEYIENFGEMRLYFN